MKTNQIQQIIESQQTYLHENHRVQVIGILGGCLLEDEQSPYDDIVLLVELEEPARMNWMRLVEVENYLSGVLGVEVNLALKDNAQTSAGRRVIEELIPI
jgi:predicted nucleotidyltransferase